MRWSRNKIVGLTVLFFYWLGLNYLSIYSPPTFFQAPDVDPIESVEFVASSATSPDELSDADWAPQSLPDSWHDNHQDIEQIWYRSSLLLAQPVDELWGIYIPTVAHNAAVYINGVWVGRGGPFSEPLSRHHNEPLLFSFSSQLLHEGENRLDIRVATTFYDQGFLSKLYLAPVELLVDAYQLKYLVRVELIRWITVAMYLIGMITFSFWLVRPQDIIYAVLSMEMMIWGTHNFNLFVAEIPFSTRLWEALMMSTLGWTIIIMVLFIHRYVGEKHEKIELFLLGLALFGLGIFLLPDVETVLHIGYRVWDVAIVIVGCYAVFILLKTYWHTQASDVCFMLFMGVFILVFGLHDILLVNHFRDRQEGLIIQYAILPALLFFSWLLVHRFVHSIERAEFLAANLEQRVQVKKEALESQFEKVKVMEQQQVLAEERERIMRDMHDGIGGHLVSVITLLQAHKGEVFKRIREKAEYSLTDLRFVIDSLDPVQYELPTLLGTMRMRLQDQLDAAKIELEWAVTDLPEIPKMSPHRSLHIMRIVQEAFTNSIKHAECHRMRLATGVVTLDVPHIFIDIIDYGKGLDLATIDEQNRGRGLKNMHHRAGQIGASLEIASSDKGTCVRLLLALAAVSE
ncbi:MAG: histidine kinase [Candidatus Polarisedimenticolaceae bacterium]|nr:histidine kinase [Candidatus Polarisedimenticolaceae bacterium]